MSLAAHWPEREGYLKGTPAPSYSCIHTRSAGNYLLSHHTCSCVQQVPGPRRRAQPDPRSCRQNRCWSSGLGACGIFRCGRCGRWWSIKNPHWNKSPPRPEGQITHLLSPYFDFSFLFGKCSFFIIKWENEKNENYLWNKAYCTYGLFFFNSGYISLLP